MFKFLLNDTSVLDFISNNNIDVDLVKISSYFTRDGIEFVKFGDKFYKVDNLESKDITESEYKETFKKLPFNRIKKCRYKFNYKISSDCINFILDVYSFPQKMMILQTNHMDDIKFLDVLNYENITENIDFLEKNISLFEGVQLFDEIGLIQSRIEKFPSPKFRFPNNFLAYDSLRILMLKNKNNEKKLKNFSKLIAPICDDNIKNIVIDCDLNDQSFEIFLKDLKRFWMHDDIKIKPFLSRVLCQNLNELKELDIQKSDELVFEKVRSIWFIFKHFGYMFCNKNFIKMKKFIKQYNKMLKKLINARQNNDLLEIFNIVDSIKFIQKKSDKIHKKFIEYLENY